MAASADALDATVAGLAARAALLGLYDAPPPEHQERAEREGWITLPTCGIVKLLRRDP